MTVTEPQHEPAAPSAPGNRRSGLSAALDLLRAMRPPQWSKNALLLAPLLLSQQVDDPRKWLNVLLGIVAFSLAASAVYLVNDLLDVRADRMHPQKRHRPFAAGRLSARLGVAAAAALTAAALLLATLFLPTAFLALLAIYLGLTAGYSLYLKRKMLLDVIVLAALYTLRLLAGGAAVDVEVSNWLLAFSMFLFFSLALGKRYTELLLLDPDAPVVTRRGYRPEDRETLAMVGVASGLLAVLVFSFYIQEAQAAARYYPQREWLWGVCPLLLYWIMRFWLLVRRGRLHHDPVVFALTDRGSLAAGALIALIVILSVFA